MLQTNGLPAQSAPLRGSGRSGRGSTQHGSGRGLQDTGSIADADSQDTEPVVTTVPAPDEEVPAADQEQTEISDKAAGMQLSDRVQKQEAPDAQDPDEDDGDNDKDA